MKSSSGRQAHEGAGPTWQPFKVRWMFFAAAAVLIIGFVVTMWLWIIAGHAKPGTDQANARLDAVRTGLAAGAGAGAAVGLMLAFRRQHHQENATRQTDHDATERRITELYTKAVEQLGSDKAPVRLGGLYALERLAQDNPAHRQTIVNVICAYLRMPFYSKAPTGKPEHAATEDPGERGAQTETRTTELSDTWQQERQVRLTAQRILADHLGDDRSEDQRSISPPNPRFWNNIRLDLTGATLIDFRLNNGVIASASFQGATFSGGAGFGETTFNGAAAFGRATFNGAAAFGRATFNGRAMFLEATFNDAAWFDGGTFNGAAMFAGKTTFNGAAGFSGVTFNGAARFGGATFSSGGGRLSFLGSRVLSPDAQHSWPTGWHIAPDGSGGYTVVRATG